jgi:hypothetical protein
MNLSEYEREREEPVHRISGLRTLEVQQGDLIQVGDHTYVFHGYCICQTISVRPVGSLAKQPLDLGRRNRPIWKLVRKDSRVGASA